jgi:predicted dinucleotide-binding enzyme
MKITVLGPGKMGSALATNWKARGHDVTVSMFRNEQKHSSLKQCDIIIESSIVHALANAEVVLLSCPYQALKALYPLHVHFTGKTVITCVNAIVPDLTGATVGINAPLAVSVAEEVQDKFPEAYVVEAFNVAFSANLVEERKDFQGHYGSIFYCGDDRRSKDVTASLIWACEYEAVNARSLISARTLETLSTAWLQFAVASGLFPRVSIKLLKR